jgi:hypothetical protein
VGVALAGLWNGCECAVPAPMQKSWQVSSSVVAAAVFCLNYNWLRGLAALWFLAWYDCQQVAVLCSMLTFCFVLNALV